MLKIIKYWGYSFEYADDILKKDRSFILEAVLLNASIIKHINPSLKEDKNFISEVLKTCHLLLNISMIILKKIKFIKIYLSSRYYV